MCHQYYGHLNGSVEAVLDANQGLADEPQPFRAGVLIVLPDLPSQIDSSVLLWD
ncbi:MULTISPECIES: tail protein X [Pseudomonas chlororaphis group]|uniref:tail protein X n=1 Tax=Pseudomonas chlororaphis group TaxID=136842 RepID=UPI00209B4527|nr:MULTISPECIES: tail protein X [Pseudomonas chlororaphis group]MCO7579131.1 tail protein X [Pseudomonas protegens]MCO7602217.1 tail protein X [Pseudomonas chlororaphis]